MTPQELQKLKKNLLEETGLIETELDRFATKNPLVKGDYQTRFPKTDQTDTPDEKAHSVTDYEEERAVEQNLEVRLREIKDTLKKISENSYGVCEKCQAQIQEERLQAISVARFCLNCAKKAQFI